MISLHYRMEGEKEYFGRIRLEKLKINNNSLSFVININDAFILSRRIVFAKEGNKKKIYLKVNNPYFETIKKVSLEVYAK